MMEDIKNMKTKKTFHKKYDFNVEKEALSFKKDFNSFKRIRKLQEITDFRNRRIQFDIIEDDYRNVYCSIRVYDFVQNKGLFIRNLIDIDENLSDNI